MISDVSSWIRARFDQIRDSLFLLPAGIVLSLAATSQLARLIDGTLQGGDNPWLLSTTVDSGRAILTTVATATVTVAAIVFSMTAVVVQLATTQFSPRVTQGFLRDRYQQVTIGITIGTFVYALLVLGSVRAFEVGPATNHDFSVTLAVVLAVLSMLAIVSFIDRIMRSMRVDSIVRSVARKSDSAIRDLPERVAVDESVRAPIDMSSATTVETTRAGWVRSVDYDAILAALPGDTSVRVEVRTGDFVVTHSGTATVWPEVDERTATAVGNAIALGQTRTIDADPAYGIRQLVDIALRALSPSLNDPTTAADVVRQLAVPLKTLLLRGFAGRVVGDERGNRVYLPRNLTHADYIYEAFTEIRLNAINQPYVLRALLETLGGLIGVMGDADDSRTSALRHQASATVQVIRDSSMPDHDKEPLFDTARAAGIDVD
ncbi:MAG: DUF2254 domain-containing protein [Acidimicrobiia bacterium]